MGGTLEPSSEVNRNPASPRRRATCLHSAAMECSHGIILREVKTNESASPPRISPSEWMTGNPTGSVILAGKDLPQLWGLSAATVKETGFDSGMAPRHLQVLGIFLSPMSFSFCPWSSTPGFRWGWRVFWPSWFLSSEPP